MEAIYSQKDLKIILSRIGVRLLQARVEAADENPENVSGLDVALDIICKIMKNDNDDIFFG